MSMPRQESMVGQTLENLYASFGCREISNSDMYDSICASKAWQGNVIWRLLSYGLVSVRRGVVNERRFGDKRARTFFRLTGKGLRLGRAWQKERDSA